MTQKIFSGLVLLLIALSIPVAFYAFGFQLGFGGDPDFYRRFAAIPIFADMHVLGAGVALLLGGFQFVGKIRNKAWLGSGRGRVRSSIAVEKPPRL